MPRTQFELGTVIAQRRLRIAGEPGREVRVYIGMPRPLENEDSEYFCPYQVVGLGQERVKHATGIDALQALELALLILPTELDFLREREPGLGWEDAPDGDYGFTPTVRAYPSSQGGKAG